MGLYPRSRGASSREPSPPYCARTFTLCGSATAFIAPDITHAYYAHPVAWNQIGFGGPASPRGYVRMQLNQSDPWEAAEARRVEELSARWKVSDDPFAGPYNKMANEIRCLVGVNLAAILVFRHFAAGSMTRIEKLSFAFGIEVFD